jgi:hypothetical protein
VKTMMIVFFNIRGVIMMDWVPEGQMVHQKYYLEALTKVWEQERRERPELWMKVHGFCICRYRYRFAICTNTIKYIVYCMLKMAVWGRNMLTDNK